MKIFNRHAGRFIAPWNAEGKVQEVTDDKGMKRIEPMPPLHNFVIEGLKESPDLPANLAEKLLKEWPKKFTADRKQVETELAAKRELEVRGNRIADLENYILGVKALFAAAGDRGNKKAAQAAAAELDGLLAGFMPGGAVPKKQAAEAPAVPAEPPAAGKTEQEEFEKGT